jgi:hypothetical protein
MKFRRGESGQALVGTMVIMVLVFAMAGSIALAASSLLDRQSSHRGAIASDLRASDAIAAAVAHVAGHGLQAQPTCTSATTFTSVLPGPYTSSTSCLRFDGIATPNVGVIPLSWNSGCVTVLLPSTAQVKTWLFFSALAGSGFTAWVDGLAACDPNSTKKECPVSVAAAAVGQAAMNCDVAEVAKPARLHIMNPLASPAAVWFAPNATPVTPSDGDAGGNPADTSGSIYMLAATTGIPAGPIEEGALFVSRDGSTAALVSEGAL